MTTANKITILRMILVPVFMAFLLVDSVACRNVALVVFMTDISRAIITKSVRLGNSWTRWRIKC